MGQPTVDMSEHYNHEELVQQVRQLKAEMRVVGAATADVLNKHNVFVGDVEQGMDGLMNTSRQHFHDMGRLTDGCQVIGAEVRSPRGVRRLPAAQRACRTRLRCVPRGVR